MEKTTKKFDAVAFMRQAREKLSNQFFHDLQRESSELERLNQKYGIVLKAMPQKNKHPVVQ